MMTEYMLTPSLFLIDKVVISTVVCLIEEQSQGKPSSMMTEYTFRPSFVSLI